MICGLDEAGRGPLAGPVCAAAVILPENFPRSLLNDSKKLSPSRRNAAMAAIYEEAAAWGIGWASAAEIDAVNILRASLLAMRRAFEALAAAFGPVRAIPPDGDDSRSAPGLYVEEAVVDGIYVPDIPLPCRALVKADSLVPEVMAASILAKTARDRTMERYSWLYPDYGYERHKGYPTREHREIITRLGPSPIQRMSFKTR